MTAMLPTPSPLTLWLLAAAGVLVLLVWLYLWLFHHRFWTTRIPPVGSPLPEVSPSSEQPPVLVVIPARDEAEVIARTVADVLRQDYHGPLHLVVVNDNSSDATAALASRSAQESMAALAPGLATLRHFDVIDGQPLPEGWSGKLWAVEQGIRHGLSTPHPANAAAHDSNAAPDAAQATQNKLSAAQDDSICDKPQANGSEPATTASTRAQFVWLTDADISHAPQVLRELVTRARVDNRALVSRMALLCTDTAAERWTIPAFVYFFQMLYPFAAIANARNPIHGAAGGCILLERAILEKIGGIGSLRGALIDDCTLAAHVARAGGRLWLELTRSSVSQRGYGGGTGVSNMIARTAYTQLHYSPLRLLGTVFGLFFTFFAPLLLPVGTIALLAYGAPVAANAAAPLLPAALAIAAPLAATAILFGTFIPMLRFYRLSTLRTLALPLIALFYLDATLKSAVRYYRGKTGNWKGRVYQNG